MHMYLFMFSIFPCYTTTLNVCVPTMPAYCFDMYDWEGRGILIKRLKDRARSGVREGGMVFVCEA